MTRRKERSMDELQAEFDALQERMKQKRNEIRAAQRKAKAEERKLDTQTKIIGGATLAHLLSGVSESVTDFDYDKAFTLIELVKMLDGENDKAVAKAMRRLVAGGFSCGDGRTAADQNALQNERRAALTAGENPYKSIAEKELGR